MLIEHLNRRSREREQQGLRRRRRVLETPCAPALRVAPDGAEADAAREMLAFCSNDYLGFANHPAIADALAEGAQRWGAGSGASALVSGHTREHARLEERLAATQAAHIPGARALSFGTGYLANLALLTTLGDAAATVFADKLNHASLVDGALLAKAELQRYAHGRIDVLADRLQRCTAQLKLIVTDAVFSMDGDEAELPALLALAERHDAWLLVDDAHGFGVLGAQGHGSLARWGLCSERLIYMGTLGKAAGVAGAFVAAHPVIVEALLQSARSYVYTTAPPPALAHALCTSLNLIEGDEGERRRAALQVRIAELRGHWASIAARHARLPWRLAPSTTAIQPLIVGDNDAALALATALEAQGLWVPAIRPPTVPIGTARLRISLSAAHRAQDLTRLTEALAALAANAAGETATAAEANA